MPELPEVETIARTLRPQLVGRKILEADVRWARTVAMPSAKKFKEQIQGQRIVEVSRRAKFLNIQLAAYNLLIHLRMSGDLLVKQGKIKLEKHDRLIFYLSPSPSPKERGESSSLVFNDTRKFGRVWLTDDTEKVLGRLGPEPLSQSFTSDWLYDSLRSRHRQLKPLLLDQTFLAGLGNIYTDEALHMAKLHPRALSDSVTAKQAEGLRQAIQTILQEGIRRNGASIDWVYRGGDFQNHFRVYGRDGELCPVCGTIIQKIIVGQRGTHFCPNCQKG
ncbi:MAG: bifunctional DNA-formamidopyrimidine glycosylase/DNA-(apurinic or apyrimidinic site) lyase [Anaerolineales bacterium]